MADTVSSDAGGEAALPPVTFIEDVLGSWALARGAGDGELLLLGPGEVRFFVSVPWILRWDETLEAGEGERLRPNPEPGETVLTESVSSSTAPSLLKAPWASSPARSRPPERLDPFLREYGAATSSLTWWRAN